MTPGPGATFPDVAEYLEQVQALELIVSDPVKVVPGGEDEETEGDEDEAAEVEDEGGRRLGFGANEFEEGSKVRVFDEIGDDIKEADGGVFGAVGDLPCVLDVEEARVVAWIAVPCPA